MSGLTKILAIHPALPIIYSVASSIMVIGRAVVFDALYDLFRYFEGPPDEPASFSETLLAEVVIGKPWLALVLGFTMGVVAFALEKRRLRRLIAENQNIEKLVRWFRLSAREKRKNREDYWPATPRKWCLIWLAVALGFCCVFRFSMTVCLFGLASPWALLYPQYRTIYGNVFAGLANAGGADYYGPSDWQRLHKKARIAVATIAMVLGCGLVVFGYFVIRITYELRDTERGVREAEVLTRRTENSTQRVSQLTCAGLELRPCSKGLRVALAIT